MKIFVVTFAFLASTAFADLARNVDIDWSTVKPIEMYPKFWDDKPAELRPPARVFENYNQGMGRIVGGQIAQPHQFPYQAGVLMFLPSIGGTALCGGALISDRTILTAAHCVDGATSGTIVLGAHFITNAQEPNQRRFTVGSQHILLHPAWNPALIRDDVALVFLPQATELIPGAIRPAILPTSEHDGVDFVAETGVISGWGVFSDAQGQASDVLRYVYDNIMPNPNCALLFFGVVQPTNICVTGANGRGACNGDSGGPLTVRRGAESMHVGIVSFGLALGCELSWPSVFARTTSYRTWIESNIQ